MLKKKIDYGIDFVTSHLAIFQCPVCGNKFVDVKENRLLCQNKHQFDLSKKGTIHFPNHHMTSGYDKEMLTSRRRAIQKGLYQPLIEFLQKELQNTPQSSYIVDMGCGEGSFIEQLAKTPSQKNSFIGFDLSKAGVNLATDFIQEAFFFIGDITQMPFQNQSIDVLLNIFSPSHYDEMRRVLKPDGYIIKVIPEDNYLKELRERFYGDQPEKQNYSNENVYEKFKKDVQLVKEERLCYQFSITEYLYQDILNMSPIHWGASDLARERAKNNPFKKLTIDLKILFGKV